MAKDYTPYDDELEEFQAFGLSKSEREARQRLDIVSHRFEGRQHFHRCQESLARLTRLMNPAGDGVAELVSAAVNEVDDRYDQLLDAADDGDLERMHQVLRNK